MQRHRARHNCGMLATGIVAIIAFAMFVKSTCFGQDPEKKSTTGVVAWLHVGDAPGRERNQAEFDQYRKTLAARIKSPTVLQAALRTPGVADLPVLKAERDPIPWLTDHLTVVSPLESEVLLVKMSELDSQQAVKIVNAVVDAFLEKANDGERAQLLGRQDLLQRALKEKDEQIATMRAKSESLSKEFTTTGDAGLVRERYASSLKLATSVRERKLDNALEAAAAKLRVAAQANSNSPEATQAKLDLSIAEAKAEILQKTAEELRQEMADCVQELQGATIGQSLRETFRAQITGYESRRKELMKDLDEIKLTINLPPRVTLLERATPPRE